MPPGEEEDAAGYRSVRAAAMVKLRLGFLLHGLDVSTYADDQVRAAVGAEAIADTDSRKDLFTRAFERLKNAGSR